MNRKFPGKYQTQQLPPIQRSISCNLPLLHYFRPPVSKQLKEERERKMMEDPQRGVDMLRKRFALFSRSKAQAPVRQKPQQYLYKASYAAYTSHKGGDYESQVITQEDLSDGLLNVMERGLIPKNGDLTPAFTHQPPFLAKAMTLKSNSTLQKKPINTMSQIIIYQPREVLNNTEIKPPELPKVHSIPEPMTFFKTIQDVVYERPEYQLVFQNAQLVQNKDLEKFVKTYAEHLRFIVPALQNAAELFKKHGIVFAKLDGDKFFRTAVHELKNPNLKDLELCAVRNQDFQKAWTVARSPEIAATKIQAMWRKYRCSKMFNSSRYQ